ncbi:MAG: LysR family transcriptional regulator [Burkholderiales bacterium]|nr:LysR family transcriptional regulator [Burkholderiales bacterium]
MPISTDMLGAFVKVAEHASVSRAAAELGVGKGVVSKRVAQLEAAVKATLFSRSTRQVALTAAGEAYLEFARRALREVSAAEERLRDLRAELSGPIRLTAPVSWGQCVLAPRLPAFLRLHPAISVELHLADRRLDLGREGYDLALRWTSQPAPELHAQAVAQVAWLLAASPAWLAEAGAPAEPEDLARHPCMGYWRESADDAWALSRGSERRCVRVSSRYHVNNPESVAEAALGGLGIGLLPDYLCTAALAEGRLQRVLPAWTPLTPYGTRITAFAPPERLRLARNRALLDFLVRALAPATGDAG